MLWRWHTNPKPKAKRLNKNGCWMRPKIHNLCTSVQEVFPVVDQIEPTHWTMLSHIGCSRSVLWPDNDAVLPGGRNWWGNDTTCSHSHLTVGKIGLEPWNDIFPRRRPFGWDCGSKFSSTGHCLEEECCELHELLVSNQPRNQRPVLRRPRLLCAETLGNPLQKKNNAIGRRWCVPRKRNHENSVPDELVVCFQSERNQLM